MEPLDVRQTVDPDLTLTFSPQGSTPREETADLQLGPNLDSALDSVALGFGVRRP